MTARRILEELGDLIANHHPELLGFDSSPYLSIGFPCQFMNLLTKELSSLSLPQFATDLKITSYHTRSGIIFCFHRLSMAEDPIVLFSLDKKKLKREVKSSEKRQQEYLKERNNSS